MDAHGRRPSKGGVVADGEVRRTESRLVFEDVATESSVGGDSAPQQGHGTHLLLLFSLQPLRRFSEGLSDLSGGRTAFDINDQPLLDLQKNGLIHESRIP